MSDLANTEPVSDVTFRQARAEGPWSNLALHSIGWKAFQDLCSQVCEVILNRPVEVFREAQDGGQDAVFILPRVDKTSADVGTVQCKHSSDPDKHLKLADLAKEIRHIEELVRIGQAHTYVLMTSMSVDATVAVAIRTRLKKLGVLKPHVFGKQFLVRAIRSSPRLRALVPQVYGLGDLTTILDQRFLQQTRALLDQWIPKLKVYVTTESHRRAVKALTEHGIVLLLGNPSAGKSAIGAILSTIASENMRHTVLTLTNPRDFEAGWNPSDPGRFFWIDDAFGANILREEYVQDWITAFRKVQAAISQGNKFLFTSRDYIYRAAKIQLGSRNLPLFADERAVVNVGDLTPAEKSQILYNHIRFGNQSRSWKQKVKSHLGAVAEVREFLPGIAERLGDPTFTKGLAITRSELIRFMREPREHLIDTINALDDRLRAGLVLVYVHQGALRLEAMDDVAARTVSELMGIPLTKILESLREMIGSFLRTVAVGNIATWAFAHPTISDAITSILHERPHMMAALLRGATIETIVNNFVCEGQMANRNAPVVPTTLDDVLIARLQKVPDEITINTSFFRFLAYRASDYVFQRIVVADPEVLARSAWSTATVSSDAKVYAHARAQRVGLLDENVRLSTATKLEDKATEEFDVAFFEDSDVLSIIPPRRLIALGMKLLAQTLPAVPDLISTIEDDSDLDSDPETHFDDFTKGLDVIEELLDLDEQANGMIETARESIASAITHLKEAKEAADEEDHSEEWKYMSSTSTATLRSATAPIRGLSGDRSVFADVDC